MKEEIQTISVHASLKKEKGGIHLSAIVDDGFETKEEIFADIEHVIRHFGTAGYKLSTMHFLKVKENYFTSENKKGKDLEIIYEPINTMFIFQRVSNS
ncbi:hypothetical protein KAT63_00460 [Candidatus Parcubacteria bacterium]|nr:hypothetical protein [Candidatus Parcubacteria bacterium]